MKLKFELDSWIGKLIIFKMSILSKLIWRVKATPIKILENSCLFEKLINIYKEIWLT